MAVVSFYNGNRQRAYPFLIRTVNDVRPGPDTLRRLPNGAIVDCGFIMSVASGFDAAAHAVFLRRVARSGSTFVLEFATNAPLLTGSYLRFTRSLSDADYLTEDIDSSETHNISESAEECDEPLWSGYLVSGRIQALADLLPADGEYVRTSDEATVEPALVQTLADGFVKALALANADRTHVTAPDGCPEIEPVIPDAIFIGATCLIGDVLFKPGYNCTLRQDTAANGLVFGASVGAGEGQPCDPVLLYEGEVPPDGSQLVEGGPQCNETLRSINGVGGPRLSLIAGSGVTIRPSPETNTLVVDVSMVGLLVCAPGVSVVSEIV